LGDKNREFLEQLYKMTYAMSPFKLYRNTNGAITAILEVEYLATHNAILTSK
jgi:hypothetical protein